MEDISKKKNFRERIIEFRMQVILYKITKWESKQQ